jgi:hypothetical protein
MPLPAPQGWQSYFGEKLGLDEDAVTVHHCLSCRMPTYWQQMTSPLHASCKEPPTTTGCKPQISVCTLKVCPGGGIEAVFSRLGGGGEVTGGGCKPVRESHSPLSLVLHLTSRYQHLTLTFVG